MTSHDARRLEQLPALTTLNIHTARSDLSFLMRFSLSSLTLVCEDAEFASALAPIRSMRMSLTHLHLQHAALESYHVGDIIRRLPKLERLQLERNPRLESLDFCLSQPMKSLRHMAIVGCDLIPTSELWTLICAMAANATGTLKSLVTDREEMQLHRMRGRIRGLTVGTAKSI
jgi:hypothetical protein